MFCTYVYTLTCAFKFWYFEQWTKRTFIGSNSQVKCMDIRTLISMHGEWVYIDELLNWAQEVIVSVQIYERIWKPMYI